MQRSYILAAFLFLSVAIAKGQDADPAAKDNMAGLGFLVGTWAEPATDSTGQQADLPPLQVWDIRFFRDSLAILLDGYMTLEAGRKQEFFSIITYGHPQGDFSYCSLFNGRSTIFRAELVDGQFSWYAGEGIKTTFSLDSDGNLDVWMAYLEHGAWTEFYRRKLYRLD